jgi:Tol biopolymer transport system component
MSYGLSEPCISDDGGFICFASVRPAGTGGSDLYVYSRSSQALVATPGLNSTGDETYPRFTHDSVRLAFVTDSAGFKRVRLYEPIGDTLIALPLLGTLPPVQDDEPAPDLHGDRIAFVSSRGGGSHVYVWNRAGGVASVPALAGDSLDIEPSLSSNGRWLAFASNRSGGAGGWDVYLYDLQSAAYVRLPRLNTSGDERHPSVSADGQLLFFAARTDSLHPYGIWRYTLADSNRVQPVNLASTTGDDRQPYARWRF